MTRDEVKILINSIAVCYQKNLMPEISKEMIDMWFLMLKDLDYKETLSATAALIALNNYPPTINQIRGKLTEVKSKSIPAEMAFNLIRDAVKRFGNYRQDEAEAWLGPEIWSVAKRYQWSYFCEMSRDNITTYSAQFRRAWEGEAEAERQMAAIPEQVRRQLEKMRPKGLPPCLAELNYTDTEFLLGEGNQKMEEREIC